MANGALYMHAEEHDLHVGLSLHLALGVISIARHSVGWYTSLSQQLVQN